jgi:succinoglycan biosynthesis transport protein ExoP
LQVIEQPIMPQKPIKPNRPKLLAASIGAATFLAFATVVLAEMLDKTIRGSRELAGVVDSHLLVTIPYITTSGELARRRRKIILLWGAIAAFLLAGLAVALYIGISVDFSWFDQSAFKYFITRLSK